MNPYVGAVVFGVIALFSVFVLGIAQGEKSMANFTPSSGIDFMPNGGLRIGIEAFFAQPGGSPNIAVKNFPVPSSGFTGMWIVAGNVAMRPPLPTQGFFGSKRVFPTDGLFRVSLVSPTEEFPMVSLILKSNEHPISTPITERHSPLKPGWTAVKVEFQQAGASVPANLELQAVGDWFK